MLLEVLSDFQISIPELGRVEARTQPVVLLTSNNTRELTEALKRRCLYLWLDYPDVEHEMEIVRLHAPELDERVARKLVEVVAMVRELDLKKPPSIAESIDWARALLLLGADDIDQQIVPGDDVGHRQAPHRPRRGGRARRSEADAGVSEPGFAARIVELGEELRAEGMQVGTSALLDAFAAIEQVGWTDHEVVPRGAGRDDGQVAGGPARLRARLRPLLLPRHRAAALEHEVREQRRREADGEGEPGQGGDVDGGELDLQALRDQIAAALRDGNEAAMRDLARLAIAAFGRQGNGSGVIGVDVQRIRRALGLRAEPQPDLPQEDPRRDGLPRDQLRKFEQLLRRELERGADRAHRAAAAQAPAQRARPRAADRRRPGPRRRSTASSRSSSGG